MIVQYEKHLDPQKIFKILIRRKILVRTVYYANFVVSRWPSVKHKMVHPFDENFLCHPSSTGISWFSPFWSLPHLLFLFLCPSSLEYEKWRDELARSASTGNNCNYIASFRCFYGGNKSRSSLSKYPWGTTLNSTWTCQQQTLRTLLNENLTITIENPVSSAL